MACLTPVTIRIDTPTGPLNSAVYESGRDKIYAVSMGRVLKLNGSTGAVEAQMRYTPQQMGDDVYVSYDSTTDSLWATAWRSTANAGSTTAEKQYDHLVRIDPDDLAIVADHDIGADLSADVNGFVDGPRQFYASAGMGWFLAYQRSTPAYRIYLYDLTNIPSSWAARSVTFTTHWMNIDLANSKLYYTYSFLNQVREADPSTLGDTGNNSALITGPTRYGYGTCWSTANSRIYLATRTQFVYKLEIGGATSSAIIDLGQADANPHNIRYNSNDGLIYVPLYEDDTVAVIDPSDDSFEIKTGFTSPWDVVFAGSKKFALQHSAIGIKEIT